MTLPPRLQRTLAQVAAIEGRGYWSGQPCRVELRPADPGTGLRFVRDDLADESDDAPGVPAIVYARLPARRRTILGGDRGAQAAMVEHVLAALAGLAIDNCEIGLTAAEVPGCDGSALPFVDAIVESGVTEQAAVCEPLVVERPIRCGDDRVWVEARPPIGPTLSIEYRLDYGPGSAIGRQWFVAEITPEAFRAEIAAARTFILESEANALRDAGLGNHVTPQDLLIFRDTPEDGSDADPNPIDNPRRFADECVRHKLLDVVGDLALAGRPIVGHIVACCSGHRLNGDLVEALLAAEATGQGRRRSA
ncbi:MAG: UDP-3-O-acyl-N-acetylglucosamine deacetylase [Planctomycetota bacterium]